MDSVCSKPQVILAIVLSLFFGVFSTIGFTSGLSNSKINKKKIKMHKVSRKFT